MKYYIGYYDNPQDKSEFTVIAITPSIYAAGFIRWAYMENDGLDEGDEDGYFVLTAAETAGKTLRY